MKTVYSVMTRFSGWASKSLFRLMSDKELGNSFASWNGRKLLSNSRLVGITDRLQTNFPPKPGFTPGFGAKLIPVVATPTAVKTWPAVVSNIWYKKQDKIITSIHKTWEMSVYVFIGLNGTYPQKIGNFTAFYSALFEIFNDLTLDLITCIQELAINDFLQLKHQRWPLKFGHEHFENLHLQHLHSHWQCHRRL